MLVRDFQVHMNGPAAKRAANLRLSAFSEAVRWRLAAHTADRAPFGKLLISIWDADGRAGGDKLESGAWLLGDIMEVRRRFSGSRVIEMSRPDLAGFLRDLCLEAVDEAALATGANLGGLTEAIADTASAEAHRFVIPTLTRKFVRARVAVETVFEISEDGSRVTTRVASDDASTTTVLATSPLPMPFFLLFAGKKIELKDGEVRFLDRRGETLTVVPVPAVPGIV